MNWREKYASKIRTPEEAVGYIKSGDRVVVGHACGEPVVLTDAMVDCAEKYDYKDVEIVHMVAMGKGKYCLPENAKHFRHNGLFLGKATADAVAEGRGDFTPCHFHEIPMLFRTCLPVDVALIQATEPDEHGMCSLGVSSDYTQTIVQVAKTVICQINPSMPRTHDNFISIDDIDVIVEKDEQIIQLPPPAIGDVQKAIGENIAGLINDGDCLQLGIGAIPDATLLFLKDKKHLGIHSEMFSDGVVELIEAGVVDNSMKKLYPNRSVASFLMGTDRLYNYVDDNPAVALLPVDYVNNPKVICQLDNVVSINSCVEVDLMGQVSSESVGLRQISGIGGQLDFVRGANMSNGGRTIIAMPATAKKGEISKVVPFLTHGGAITTPRCDVNYIVTEYGIAQLKGQTLKSRAKQLINIAAPNFRDELKEEFERRFHEKF